MGGSTLVSLFIGVFGFLLVFLLSINTNTFETSLIRGFVSFLGFYLFGFVINWVIRYVLTDNKNSIETKEEQHNQKDATNTDTNHHNDSEPKDAFQDNPALEGEGFEKRTSEYVRELLDED